MSQEVTYKVDDGVAVLTLQNPPLNALTAKVRSSLMKCIDRAAADENVHVLLICGSGDSFSVGQNNDDYGKPATDVTTAEICNAIEGMSKPVVAAIGGVALKEGLELALACHYRVANTQASVGFTQVAVGLLPGAGGTQRAARLLGADVSLEMMLSGKIVQAADASLEPLFDLVVDEQADVVGLKFAVQIFAEKVPVRRTRDMRARLTDAAGFQAAVDRWRKRIGGRSEPAIGEILRCVEAAALLPFEVGLSFERSAFEELEKSEQFRALSHMQIARHKAAQNPERTKGKPRVIRVVGVIGGGARGAGFAGAALMAGYEVVLVEKDAPSMERAQKNVQRLLDRNQKRGRLSSVRREALDGKLQANTDLVALSDVDLIIEATGPEAATRAQVFSQLDGIVKTGAVLATAWPFADIPHLASLSGCPGDVLGIHIPTPTQTSAVAEIATTPQSDPDAVLTAQSFIQKIGKSTVRCNAHPGLVGHHIMAAYQHAADRLVLRGCSPQEVDAAMRAWGMTLGPFQNADLMGLDRAWLRQKICGVDGSSGVLHRMVKAGRLGRANGKGWVRYERSNPLGASDPEVDEILKPLRDAISPEPHAVGPEDIQARCLAAMANAGAGLLKEGVVQRPSDIDVVMVLGFGFPSWRGGPMQAADEAGLLNIRNHIRDFADSDPGFWVPEPHFDLLIKNGQNFSDLNG
ncbi:3-hydroxyacyl-CoA dehydrogenase NAD-binding domain-containing protein [Shimia sp.]|uniref:3-hydroxyacyl-CoA dehydrogenase NAD-binding domain-containing protein n=1 Tax=Shimia sp. TaxID=1954381 RepID=UPI0032989578